MAHLLRKWVWRRGRRGTTGTTRYEWAASSGTPAPGYTHARASTALGLTGSSYAAALYASYATDAPRFERLADEAVGLLIEGARTNITVRSQELDDNTGWSHAGNITVSVDSATSPNGSAVADKLVEDSSNLLHNIFPNSQYSLTSGQAYSISAYALGTQRLLQLFPSFSNGGNCGGKYDLSGPTATSVAGTGSGVASLKAFGASWYRCMLSYLTQTTANVRSFYGLANSVGLALNGAYQGDGSSGLTLWGLQTEAGSFVSSPIPTTTVAVTRAADTHTRTVTLPAGGFCYLVKGRTALGTSGTQTFHRLDDGTDNEYARVSRNSSGHIIVDVVTGAGSVAALDLGAVADDTTFLVGVKVAANDFAASLNNGTCVTDSSGAIPVGMVNERLGHGRVANECFGHILYSNSSQTRWRGALTNAQVQAMVPLS